MAKYSLDNSRTVGQGNLAPPGSVTDAALATAISRYKRGVASRYTALVPDEVGTRLPPGPYFVSPKIDGEQWCLVIDEGYQRYGAGAEIAALVGENLFFDLEAPVRRLGAMDVPVPFSPTLEDLTIPGKEQVVEIARQMFED